MANHLGFVFSDRPIEALEDDLIWNSNIAVRSFVNDVANRLASPLGSDSPMLDTNSLAFAVHGRWGAGKSSLIKLTIARAREIARGYQRDSDLLACWYNASAAENTRSRARGSLGLQILMTLASAAIDPEGRRDINPYREVVRLFSRYFNGGANAPGEKAGLSLDDPQKMREYLSHLERSVAALPDFDTLLQREINGTGMIDHEAKS